MDLAAEDRARLVRRNTMLLVGAQVALWGSAGAFATFGPISVFNLTGRESMAAVLIGVFYVALAVGARPAGRFMDRAGRRPGLAAGYLTVLVGGSVAAVAVAVESAAVLLAGTLLMGLGASAALLGRTAVADMYPPERRGRAIGALLVAGTAGAVGGPPLAGAIHALARAVGLGKPLVVPWLLVPVLSAVALAFVLSLRPDPRDLAAQGSGGGTARRPGRILRLRPAVAAVGTIAAAQVVMVTFMGVVPVVLHSHGAGEVTVSIVVSLHLAGMFAFSSLVGAALDRWGRVVGLVAGLALSASGVVLSAATGATAIPAAGLLLIGVGWSAAYLGSTAVISDLAEPTERAGALGLTDLIAAVSAAIGVLSGAVLLEAAGFSSLRVIALVLLAATGGLLALLRASAPAPVPAPPAS